MVEVIYDNRLKRKGCQGIKHRNLKDPPLPPSGAGDMNPTHPAILVYTYYAILSNLG